MRIATISSFSSNAKNIMLDFYKTHGNEHDHYGHFLSAVMSAAALDGIVRGVFSQNDWAVDPKIDTAAYYAADENEHSDFFDNFRAELIQAITKMGHSEAEFVANEIISNMKSILKFLAHEAKNGKYI